MDKSTFFPRLRFLKSTPAVVFLLIVVHSSLFAAPELELGKETENSIETSAGQAELKAPIESVSEPEPSVKASEAQVLEEESEDSFTHVSIEAKDVIGKTDSGSPVVSAEDSSVSSKILERLEKESAPADLPEKAVSKQDEIILPGGKPIHVFDSQDSNLNALAELDIAGTGLTYTQKPFLTQRPKEPVDSYSEFTEMTSRIFWFAFFQEGRSHEERMARPKFSVEWFAPDGQLVYYGSFRANIAYPDYVKTGLPLSRLGMPDVTGRWRVRVTSGDKLVDERQFTVTRAG